MLTENYDWFNTPCLQERMNMTCREGKKYLLRLERMQTHGFSHNSVYTYHLSMCEFALEFLRIRAARDERASIERKVQRALRILKRG